MTSDGAAEWIRGITADAPTYVNGVTTASLLAVQRYDTSRAAASVAVPLRVILAAEDTITPARQVRKALGRNATDRELDVVEFPETHFELFDEHLTGTVDRTVEWFVEHL
jgi:hypothetical protein